MERTVANRRNGEVMLPKSLAATVIPLLTTLITVSTGAAFASSPQVSGPAGAEPAAALTETLNVLHAVKTWGVESSVRWQMRRKGGAPKDSVPEVTATGA